MGAKSEDVPFLKKIIAKKGKKLTALERRYNMAIDLLKEQIQATNHNFRSYHILRNEGIKFRSKVEIANEKIVVPAELFIREALKQKIRKAIQIQFDGLDLNDAKFLVHGQPLMKRALRDPEFMKEVGKVIEQVMFDAYNVGTSQHLLQRATQKKKLDQKSQILQAK